MLTPKKFKAPDILKGDIEDLRRVVKAFADFLNDLEGPGSLAITEAGINSTPIGDENPSSGAFTTLSASGNFTMSGAGSKWTADWSNATVTSRVSLQSSTTNGNTVIPILPNGTSTTSGVVLSNSSDIDNAGRFFMQALSDRFRWLSTLAGTGVARDFTWEGAAELARLTTSGDFSVVGAVTVGGDLTVNGVNLTCNTATGDAFVVNNSLGWIGYVTGAGGSVAQGSGSGKATAVSLSKPCGQITMDGATLNANTTVSFPLTNLLIAATDVLVLNHVSGGTPGSYLLNAQCGSTSASINVRNITAGNLSEAIVISFALIKGVTS